MAGSIASLQPTHQQNHTLDFVSSAHDPGSLDVSMFSNSHVFDLLEVTTESFVIERGPRYKAYAELRESKLRMKNASQQQSQQREMVPNLSLPKGQVRFQGSFLSQAPATATAIATVEQKLKKLSILTQSASDFSAALRKENRRPAMEGPLTPQAGMKNSKLYGVGVKLTRSKSINSGERRSFGFVGKKSYGTVEELKGLSSPTANAENRGGRGGRGASYGKSVLGSRQH